MIEAARVGATGEGLADPVRLRAALPVPTDVADACALVADVVAITVAVTVVQRSAAARAVVPTDCC